jgi:hypothetical protein
MLAKPDFWGRNIGMMISTRVFPLVSALTLLLASCDSSGLATYCDPKTKVVFDYPAGWSIEHHSNAQASGATLKPDPDSDERAVSVSVAMTTPDSAKLQTAAGRIANLASFTPATTAELAISHPEHDSSGMLLDHGTRQVQMVYVVMGEPAMFEVIATQRVNGVVSDEQTETFRAIVHSIRRDVEMSCAAK